MRTVLERVTKRLSTSVSNQLIGVAASAIPNKEAVHLQMDSPINIHQVNNLYFSINILKLNSFSNYYYRLK